MVEVLRYPDIIDDNYHHFHVFPAKITIPAVLLSPNFLMVLVVPFVISGATDGF